MSQRLNGSLNFTALFAAAQAGHSAFRRWKGQDGKEIIFVNITQWINDAPDQKGNDSSVLLNSTKEGKEAGETKVYVANLKKSDASANTAPLGKGSFGNSSFNSIGGGTTNNTGGGAIEPLDDLPF